MKIDIWVPVITAIASALVANLITVYLRRQDKRDVRASIRADLDLLGNLPTTGDLRTKVEQHIEHRYLKLIEQERNARQDPAGISAAIFLLIVAAALMYPAIAYDGWYWWIPFTIGALVAIGGLVGFLDSVVRKPRTPRASRRRGQQAQNTP